ncbi:MAG TPA: TilS substrate-binding domain-containing protein, partial [Actinomycetota bacterium]|nr:TilS substrate-binding domain-containing protein [Actinomycetota bacterium]
DPLVATALAGAVDSREPPVPPPATLPVGAPPSRGRGAGRPEPGSVALDALTLAELPVALGRRVVREAARRAGATVPDAAATDRVLALTDAADGAGTGWPGGSAAREGTVVRVRVPPD